MVLGVLKQSHIFSGPYSPYHGFARLHEIHGIPRQMDLPPSIYLYPDPDRQTSEQHLSEIRTDIHMVEVKSCTSKLTPYRKALKQLLNYLY